MIIIIFSSLGPCQTVSSIFNLIILLCISIKVHISHHLLTNKTPYSTFYKTLAAFAILIQILGYLSAWIIIAVRIQEYVILCIVFSILISFLLLKYFVFNPGTEVDKEIWKDTLKNDRIEIDSIFWKAAFSTWVTPVTSWWDISTLRFYKDHLTTKRKYFMLTSSIITTATVIIFLQGSLFIVNDLSDINVNSTNVTNQKTEVWLKFNMEETSGLILKGSEPWTFRFLLICVAAACFLHLKGNKFKLLGRNNKKC